MGPDGFQILISLALSETIDEVANPPLVGSRKDCLENTWARYSPTASHVLPGALLDCFQINIEVNHLDHKRCTASIVSELP